MEFQDLFHGLVSFFGVRCHCAQEEDAKDSAESLVRGERGTREGIGIDDPLHCMEEYEIEEIHVDVLTQDPFIFCLLHQSFHLDENMDPAEFFDVRPDTRKIPANIFEERRIDPLRDLTNDGKNLSQLLLERFVGRDHGIDRPIEVRPDGPRLPGEVEERDGARPGGRPDRCGL